MGACAGVWDWARLGAERLKVDDDLMGVPLEEEISEDAINFIWRRICASLLQ